MKTRNIRQGRLPSILCLMASLVPSISLVAWQGEGHPQPRQWPMKYEEGPVWVKAGTKVKVTANSETILAESKKGIVVSIPVADVTQVYYEPKTHRRSTPVLRSVREALTETRLAKILMANEKQVQFERALVDKHGIFVPTAGSRRGIGCSPEYTQALVNPAAIAGCVPVTTAPPYNGRIPSEYVPSWEVIVLDRERREAWTDIEEICRESPGCDPGFVLAEGAFGLAYAIGGLIPAAILAPFKTTRHFVTIRWQDGAGQDEVIFKVGKGEYKSFSEVLVKVTGKPWRNRPEVLEPLRHSRNTGSKEPTMEPTNLPWNQISWKEPDERSQLPTGDGDQMTSTLQGRQAVNLASDSRWTIPGHSYTLAHERCKIVLARRERRAHYLKDELSERPSTSCERFLSLRSEPMAVAQGGHK